MNHVFWLLLSAPELLEMPVALQEQTCVILYHLLCRAVLVNDVSHALSGIFATQNTPEGLVEAPVSKL